VSVELDEKNRVRLDLFGSSDECFAFEDVRVWSGLIVVGWGHHLYLVNPNSKGISALDLGSYFGQLYPANDYLLVASAERLYRIGPNAALLWSTGPLGIDGVVVKQVKDGIIHGEGEGDPSGGWRQFRVSLSTGQAL
jgi:hypothetical protein